MTESTVSLVNKSRRTHVIVLDHEVFRNKRYGFTVRSQPVIDESPDGTRTQRQVRRALPGSLTLFPGERIDGLHPAIEKVPQVASLLKAKLVAIDAEPVSPRGDTEPAPAPHPPQDDHARARLGRKKDESRED